MGRSQTLDANYRAMVKITKRGKSTKIGKACCYGNACLKDVESDCSYGIAHAIGPGLKQESSMPICYQANHSKNDQIAEVLCKELGFPVHVNSKPTRTAVSGSTACRGLSCEGHEVSVNDCSNISPTSQNWIKIRCPVIT